MARARDERKEARWRRLVRERAASGRSVAEFCRRRRIASQQFYWWQRQLLDRDGNGSKAEGSSRPASFVPVRVVLSSPAIELVHPSGCLIRVAAGAETSTLRSVLKALSASEE